MKVQIVSDLHLDHYLDQDDYLIQDLDPEDCGLLVVAGDLCGDWYLRERATQDFEVLCAKYPNVLYILGNHEYYDSTFEETQERFRALGQRFDNLFCLDNESVVIDGVSIAGTTLWFRNTPMNQIYERQMSDFSCIKDFRSWVYSQNVESIAFLQDMQDIDLVVTHHMPSTQSVHARYATEPTNLYFLCDVSEIILDKKPKVWCHGHTHIPCEYRLGETQVICNPRGYPGEGAKGYKARVIEI